MTETSQENKFVIVVRHGELDNPRDIVYNRDSVMKPEDIIHLSQLGVNQIRDLGEIIKQKGFNVVRIAMSPETRVRESAEALNKQLEVEDVAEDPRLDDAYVPGPYIEGMKMNELVAMKGNFYEDKYDKYNHEKPETVRDRVKECFKEVASSLQKGETAILVSHGDSISWFLNDLITGKLPEPDRLKDSIYPEKGLGFVLVLDDNNKLVEHYKLTPELVGNKY